MTEQRPTRSWMWIVHVRQPDGDMHAQFTIDERSYPDLAASKAVVREASEELYRRRMLAEFEAIQVRLDEPGADLPTWDEYRQRLPDLGAEDQA